MLYSQNLKHDRSSNDYPENELPTRESHLLSSVLNFRGNHEQDYPNSLKQNCGRPYPIAPEPLL